MVFWNVRSLYNKIDSIRVEIDKINPDIVNLNETWLHDKIDNGLISIKDYILIRSDRKSYDGEVAKKGGGLCTYVRKTYIFEENKEMTIINKNIELHVMKYKLPFTRPIYMINVYRPPAGDIDAFISALNQCIACFRNEKCDIFIGVDLNVDMQHPNSPNTKKLKTFFKLNQLKDRVGWSPPEIS